MKVYFLGCGGWIPDRDETCCFMIEHKEQLFFLDAGTGISNLKRYPHILDKYANLTVILSHYHLDHIIGLTYLLPYIKGKKMKIYGPGIPFYKHTTEEILEQLFQSFFFSCPLQKVCEGVKCFDYAGRDFYVNDVLFSIKEQQHSAPSFRITVDKKLIYATDTQFDPMEWKDDYQGMTLLHECWEIVSNFENKHTSIESLLQGLPPYLLKSTYFIHKNPEWETEDYGKLHSLAKSVGGYIARDGMVLEL